MHKKVISDFFETTTRRLTVLHPTLCIEKNLVAKFIHNYTVEKVKTCLGLMSAVFEEFRKNTERGENTPPPPNRNRVNYNHWFYKQCYGYEKIRYNLNFFLLRVNCVFGGTEQN